MGVHISFVRSTVLDSWNDTQLRTMKLGGNGAAAAALNVPVGRVPASASKYESRAAIDYKRQLSMRVKQDQHLSSDPFAEAPSSGNSSELISLEEKESVALPMEKSIWDDHAKPVAFVPVPSSQASKKPIVKGGKLGAVKSSAISFDQLEAQSLEESFPEPETVASQPSFEPTPNISPTDGSVPLKAQAPRKAEPPSREQQMAMDRLGMGVKKLNLAAPPPAAAPSTEKRFISKALTEEPKGSKTVKSVSSDQYFGRGQEDTYAQEQRMRSIQGATSVSSTQFFGQDESEEATSPFESIGSATGIWSSLESAVRTVLHDEGVDDDEEEVSF